MVQPHARPSALPLNLVDSLQVITHELSRQFYCLTAWQTSARSLGKPFDSLSPRELVVLRSLNSDVCEKQLAHQLGLRPHTLHSQIKSIYYKLGVQGRLSLIHRLNSALSDLRIKVHRTHNRLSEVPYDGSRPNE